MTPEVLGALLPPEQQERLIAARRDLHRHPELAYEEVRTASLVADRLAALGCAGVRTGVAETGVVAHVGAGGGRRVLLRADMDALPIDEASDVPYRSTAPGRMHACGHDGHTAALLTVAERLRADPPPTGEVRLCFQPAEEGRGGAARMLEQGVLDGVDAAFAVHLWNSLPTGKVAIPTGPVFGAADRFEVTVVGAGGHGALPHQARDPVVAAAAVVTALQTIPSRRADPLDGVVVTVGRFVAGESFNVIPDAAHLLGTCRALSREAHARLPRLFREVVEGTARAHGCEAQIRYEQLCTPTVNPPAMAALAREVAGALLGPDAVVTDGPGARALAAEDFGMFLERVPGALLLVGSRDEASGKVHPHHSPRFDFDEAALGIAVRLLEELARRWLAPG